MHRKRGYRREIPLLRDDTLFAIACEGSKREPAYFNLFPFISENIKVDIIGDEDETEENIMEANQRRDMCWTELKIILKRRG